MQMESFIQLVNKPSFQQLDRLRMLVVIGVIQGGLAKRVLLSLVRTSAQQQLYALDELRLR